MTAYNQEDFIAQAIDGVLSQKTTFPVELHIGDDCSTDRTSDICSEYSERFPEYVKHHRRDPNLGMMPNFLRTLNECDGDYIAICEGDDYWIDESKLQQQFDFLESNPDYSMVGHNHFQLQDGKMIEGYPQIADDFRSLETADYILNPHFQTASYFFRRSALPDEFPIWYRNVLAGDHFLVLLLSLKGKIGFINKRMSVFRTYSTSVTGTRGPLRIKENFVEHLDIFDRETDGKFSVPIDTVKRSWDLGYKVYEPVGYFSKLGYFVRNFPFYFSNFGRVGGLKLAAKYILGTSVFNSAKERLS